MSKNISIIGATGMIGIPVTKELVKAGFNVTALVRNPEKAKSIFPAGVNFVKGDLDDKIQSGLLLKMRMDCISIFQPALRIKKTSSILKLKV
ncbi:MAG: NAD(P)H-binding protein [Saprospiraceae bacterium]|nr:NAD(P)H-binding protein [Saprospiraceae bacterium]